MLSLIWGNSEVRYSAVMAQSILLLSSLQEALLKKAGMEQPGEVIEIQTEKDLGNGFLDIYIEYDQLIIGIENKIGAGFQLDQLKRYEKVLAERAKKEGKEYKLICLHPAAYRVPESEKTKKLIEWTYREIIETLRGMQGNAGMEIRYRELLIDYMEEIEMVPLTNADISLLGQSEAVERAYKKMRPILAGIRQDTDGGIEEKRGAYLLFSRTLAPEWHLYVGFRFGAGWYFDKPMLDRQKPECIVYIKNVWENSLRDQNKKVLAGIETAMQTAMPKMQVVYEPSAEKGKAILFVRAMMQANNSMVAKWLDDTAQKIEKAFEQCRTI